MQSLPIVGRPRSSGASFTSSSVSIFDNQENRVPKRPKSIHVYGYTNSNTGVSVPVERAPLSSKTLNLKAASMSEMRSTPESCAIDPYCEKVSRETIRRRSDSHHTNSQSKIYHDIVSIESSDTVDDSESEPEVLLSSSAHTSQKGTNGGSSDRVPFSEALVDITVDTSFVEPDARCFDRSGTGNFCVQDFAQNSDITSEPMIHAASDHTATSEYHSEKTGFQHASVTSQFMENEEDCVHRPESFSTVCDQLYPRIFHSDTTEGPLAMSRSVSVSAPLSEGFLSEVVQIERQSQKHKIPTPAELLGDAHHPLDEDQPAACEHSAESIGGPSSSANPGARVDRISGMNSTANTSHPDASSDRDEFLETPKTSSHAHALNYLVGISDKPTNGNCSITCRNEGDNQDILSKSHKFNELDHPDVILEIAGDPHRSNAHDNPIDTIDTHENAIPSVGQHNSSSAPLPESPPTVLELPKNGMTPIDMMISDTVEIRNPYSHKREPQKKAPSLFVTLPACDSRNNPLYSSTSNDILGPVKDISEREKARKSASEPPISNLLVPESLFRTMLADNCESPKPSNQRAVKSRNSLQKRPIKSLREICSNTSSSSQTRRVGLSKRRRIDPLHRR